VRENRQILAWPQPFVLFRKFGGDGLEFELRGYVSDVEKSGLISSDLHFAVDKEFRAAGIEIPFAQRDLRIRNVDEIARAITESSERHPSAPRSDQRDNIASAHPPSRRG